MNNSIDDVRRFWDANPLLSGELKQSLGTREWFEEFDRIKTNDVFLNDLSKWVNGKLVGKRVLDVGCGPGYWNRRLGVMDLEYYGVDLSPRSVELAKGAQRIFKTNGVLMVGNAEELPFDDSFFDHIISEGVIHHTPNTEKCVQEVHRVLRKGGTFCISLYYKNILLRSKTLFRMTRVVMQKMGVLLRGRGREQMVHAESPEEFVRMYDGAENPIGKAYDKVELSKMFARFSTLRFSLYYIPMRALPVKMPIPLIRPASRCFGTMILVEGRK